MFYNTNNEGFVNTKTCLSLTTDQIIKANTICNNLVNSNSSNCIEIINAVACPVDGVATNAMLLNLTKEPTTNDLEKKTPMITPIMQNTQKDSTPASIPNSSLDTQPPLPNSTLVSKPSLQYKEINPPPPTPSIPVE